MLSQDSVLLIDDDEIFCANAKSFFAQKAISIVTLSDPTLALALDFSRFRVVLLDIDMPKVNGLELLSRVGEENRPVVIMVSAHGDLESRISCLANGADFFVTKPLNIGELALIVERALGRKDPTESEGPSWRLCRSELSLTTPDGQVFGLASSEFRVLELLISRAPNDVSKEELTEAATGRSDVTLAYSRSLEVLLSRIRRRVSGDDHKLPVKSLRNVGYLFHGVGVVVA
ncbi:MAG: response regulator transcription factor [Marivivens sp.]|nr:response regulator transcription factor [Marivivens sp.]